MLTRADFDVAVKDALRNYTRADLLLGNRLLDTGIGAGHGSKTEDVAHLQRALADAVDTIFVNERDQKIQRVLQLTYLRPAPKQEAVAERLGLPFSTYRRHLTAGIERLTEWLWPARFGGFVAQYMGDGILIYVDWPQASENNAERAVHAGLHILKMLAESERGNASFSVRISIAGGLVVVGETIGTGLGQEILATKPALLGRHAEQAGLMADAARYLLRAGQISTEGSAMAEARATLMHGLDAAEKIPDGSERQLLQAELQVALSNVQMAVLGFGATAHGEVS